jgi:hypothetical protein
MPAKHPCRQAACRASGFLQQALSDILRRGGKEKVLRFAYAPTRYFRRQIAARPGRRLAIRTAIRTNARAGVRHAWVAYEVPRRSGFGHRHATGSGHAPAGLDLAFSRDQPEKLCAQHSITERRFCTHSDQQGRSALLAAPASNDCVHVEVIRPILPFAIEVDVVAVGCRIWLLELQPSG